MFTKKQVRQIAEVLNNYNNDVYNYSKEEQDTLLDALNKLVRSFDEMFTNDNPNFGPSDEAEKFVEAVYGK